MRDKQGVPCNLPEALLRNPNCWPLGTRTSTRRGGPRHQVPVGDQANTWSSQTGRARQACCDAGPRCWWPATVGGVVVVVAAEAAATGSPISNSPILKSSNAQSSQATRRIGWVYVFRQPEKEARKPYKREIATYVGVDYCCACCVLFAPVLETRRA